MANTNPVITLLTDFGHRDYYVAAMKGVILGICARAEIIDVTHEVSPYEIAEGAFLLSQTWECFPPKTVHVVVVDPGVGSMRRPIYVEYGRHRFIAPDNGVLTPVLSLPGCKVRHITSDVYFRHPVSSTFHGRDIFAPVAAHVAKGVRPPKLGPLIQNHLRLAFDRPSRTARRGWTGRILHIDRFGNIVTNIRPEDFPQIASETFEVTIGFRTVGKLARNYSEMPPGELFAIVGSAGYLEISANQQSAARIVGCEAGAPIDITIF